VQHRSYRGFLAAVCLFLTSLLPAQELLPKEAEALQARADGRPLAATRALLAQAAELAAVAEVDAHTAARIEAWATLAARLARSLADADALPGLDALATSPAARAMPLLADRLHLAALELAETLPGGDAARRAAALGFLTGGRLLGPFANERSAGFASDVGPERAVDFAAELPGKRRPVRWRALPTRPLSPVVPLGQIVHPSEQSLVFVAYALVAEQPTEAVLELGCTGSWAVFVNGTARGDRHVERPMQYDQDTLAVPLQAGPNLLLLKLGHLEGAEFAFAARLRARDGAPLAGVVHRDDEATLRAAAAVRAEATPATAPPPLGGRTTWPIGGAAAADALRLAWLWNARQSDGDRDRRDAAAATAATQALPDVAAAWLALAASQLRHGRSAADRDDNERRSTLLEALRRDPDHVEAKILLARLLRDGSNLWRQARTLFDEVLARHPDQPMARWLRTITLRDEGLGELADAELLRIAATAERPELWRAAAGVLANRDPGAALAFQQRVVARSVAEADVATAIRLAQRLPASPAWPDPDPLLADPFARGLHLLRAELRLGAAQPRQALAGLDRWLGLAPDDAEAMTLAARCWRALRTDDPTAHDRQLHWLRQALAIEPNRRDDERYAEFVAAEVIDPAGGAGSADAAAFHAVFAVDAAEIVRGDGGPPADAAAAHDPLHWLLRQQVVRANGNGTTNVYRHDIVRVLTTDGARSLSSWNLPHWPGEQRARLLGCTVFRADGTVQRPALQGARVRLPDLRPGDVVAIEGRVDDLQPTFFGDYFGLVHVFAGPDGSPVRRDELVVLAAPGRAYRWQAANGAPEPECLTLADGTQQFRFAMQDLRRDQPEIRRPRRTELEPVVRMTTYRDWDQFAAWWWNLIKDQLEVTPAMRETVQTRCAGLPTVEAKIAALYHFVTTDVRYEAWEFGVHGYKPYSTGVIHERRHGDCKDKALLLCALLGEIGVQCHPVLIFADALRSRDDLTLPLVQQFNHCIAWLPPQDGRPGRFLDGTATWHPSDTLPDMDQGASVLVVDRGRAELREVPWTTPDANVDRQTFHVQLAADGSASVRRESRPSGNQAIGLREALATEPARLRETVERELVRTFGRAELRAVEPGGTEDPEAPVHLTVTAALPEIGQRRGAAWQLPSAWDEGHLLALTAEGDRRSPLLLGAPSAEVQTLRYELPPGFRAGELPPDATRATPFGTFAVRWRLDGSAVVVERELRLFTSRIAPDEYAQFRDFAAALKAADGQFVLLQQEGLR